MPGRLSVCDGAFEMSPAGDAPITMVGDDNLLAYILIGVVMNLGQGWMGRVGIMPPLVGR